MKTINSTISDITELKPFKSERILIEDSKSISSLKSENKSHIDEIPQKINSKEPNLFNAELSPFDACIKLDNNTGPISRLVCFGVSGELPITNKPLIAKNSFNIERIEI
jgi:hypothetical protein